jgi:hypothetical protein
MSQTFDHKRKVKPLNLEDIDIGFKDWFDKKLNIHLMNNQGNRVKIPVKLMAGERWASARQDFVRDDDGTLLLPIIAISRTSKTGDPGDPLSRIFADTNQDHTYYKQVDPKSSLIKELVKSRPKNIDPSLPIYEVFTHKAPDHRILTYEVSIWTATVEDMNEVTQKIGQELNFKSVRSFQFESQDGFKFQAFEESEIESESNTGDFTNQERKVQEIFRYRVPGYTMPESNEKPDVFKRYFSQTKLVFKKEVVKKIEK